MSIRCPNCKREYDVTLFEFGRDITCECGNKVSLKHEETLSQVDEISRRYELKREEDNLLEIRKAQDKIVSLILTTDYPEIDIEIEKAKFKDLIERLFPDKAYLYELIYEPRFKRLWQQFRKPNTEKERL